MKFGSNKKYVKELLNIVKDYREVHERYNILNDELEVLSSKITDLELEKKECEMKLEFNRKREKDFLAKLQETDYEAFKDLTENIQEYVNENN